MPAQPCSSSLHPLPYLLRPAAIGRPGRAACVWLCWLLQIPVLLALLCALLPAQAQQRFIYPANEIPNDTRFADLIELLQTALDKTVPEYGPYQLAPAAEVMSKARYLAALEDGQEPNIIWSSTSIELEQRLLPIRLPLRRGLLGYRICLIRADQQEKTDTIRGLADLRNFSIGQGQGWGDSALYEALNIRVERAKYGNLFSMLGNQRFDLFPRGVNEVFAEYAQQRHANPTLAIEKNLLLHYPWPYYFFFAKNDSKRAQRVEAGLRKMIRDGSFRSIFLKHHGRALEQANLRQRRVLQIPNPLLPPETPLQDSSLWFDPQRGY